MKLRKPVTWTGILAAYVKKKSKRQAYRQMEYVVEPINLADIFLLTSTTNADQNMRIIRAMLMISYIIVLLFMFFHFARMNRYLLDKSRTWLQYTAFCFKCFVFMMLVMFVNFSLFLAALQLSGHDAIDMFTNPHKYQKNRASTPPMAE